VYIAGPAFGARAAAGNPIEDIARLCDYAHRFGVRIYVTLNTILFDSELESAARMIRDIHEAGADAIIVQDPAVLALGEGKGVYHASTQCAIRTPGKAAFLESLGFGRLILERQLSLDEIRAIRAATNAEIEFFVHGALCVSYSGQCYLSEKLTGRSANRGECIQACRSLYDLEDASGKVLGRRKAYLSLKDLMLIDELEELADAGVDSFKIEGRLKNSSYVQSVVKSYSAALDALIKKYPDRYCRSSFGRSSSGGAVPLEKTFNRGYTQLYIHGKKGSWGALTTPKSMGEAVGEVESIKRGQGNCIIKVRTSSPEISFRSGDGFAFVRKDGGIGGFKGFRCSGNTIECRLPDGLAPGMALYRNLSVEFEKTLAADGAVREIAARIDATFSPSEVKVKAVSEDGREVRFSLGFEAESAKNEERARETVLAQLGKRSSIYSFRPGEIEFEGAVPFLPASFLNSIRREAASRLDGVPLKMRPLRKGDEAPQRLKDSGVDYKANAANHITKELYRSLGADKVDDAYELSHVGGAELMRSRYCLRNELGICPKQKPGTKPEPLFLKNNGRTLTLEFHCAECEMVVK